MHVKFKVWNCIIKFGKYSNGRTAIQLVDDCEGFPVATATVNIPSIELQPDEVIIKNYSENEGMYQALVDAGIIASTVIYVKRGYIICPICKLLVDPNDFKTNSHADTIQKPKL